MLGMTLPHLTIYEIGAVHFTAGERDPPSSSLPLSNHDAGSLCRVVTSRSPNEDNAFSWTAIPQILSYYSTGKRTSSKQTGHSLGSPSSSAAGWLVGTGFMGLFLGGTGTARPASQTPFPQSLAGPPLRRT